MAFQYVLVQGAVDEIRQIAVSVSSAFYDDLIHRLHYVYRRGDMVLDFVAITDLGAIPGAEKLPGSNWIPSWTTASHVDETELRAAFAEAVYPMHVDEVLFTDVKDTLSEGLFVLVTEGGKYRGVSPDFTVDFDGRNR